MWSSLELLTGQVWGSLATSLCQVNRSLTSPVAALRAVLFAVSSSLVCWERGREIPSGDPQVSAKCRLLWAPRAEEPGSFYFILCGFLYFNNLPLWSTHWRPAAAPCGAALVTVGGAVLPPGGAFLSPRCRLRGARSPLQTQPLMTPPRCHRSISAKMQCARHLETLSFGCAQTEERTESRYHW